MISGAENRRLLVATLADRYDVVTDIERLDRTSPLGPFDLCILDGVALAARATALANLRAAFDPIFLPVLMLSDRRDLGAMPPDVRAVVDDVLMRPLERAELALRLQTLLRTRALSLRLTSLNADYDAERRITNRFQEAALPQALPHIPGLALDAHYRAGRAEARIGGDWYDAFRLIDGRVVLSVGDVSGSGLEAAVTMGSVRQVLRGVAQIHPDPAAMLDAADRTLRGDGFASFVTAFVGIFDPVLSELTYASAGHPRPLVRSGAAWQPLAGTGVPLGVAGGGPRTSTIVDIAEDAILVLYTDGLIEATRDIATGERLLREALADDAVVAAPNPARAIYGAVLGDEDASDDTAIFVVRRVPNASARAIGSWTFDVADADAARAVQRDVVDRLHGFGLNAKAIQAASVVFAELLGNVVRYAKGEACVALDCSGELPVLHVLDQGPGFRHAPKLPEDMLSENGRGLFIVSTLARDFTVSHRRGPGSHARAVLEPHVEG